MEPFPSASFCRNGAYRRHCFQFVMVSSHRTVAEEMPDAYKDVDDVVQAIQDAGLANKVTTLSPRLVIKG
ncbi:MAG: RtcB family protein [Parachlamydia sp.]|nr:RtcB family protein [Parachlamydia sp.]